MEKTESTMFEDFKKIQDEMPVIGQNKTVKGAFSFKYADITKIWEIARPIIAKNNFVVTHEITEAGVKTIAIHKSGEKLSTLIPFSNIDIKPQDKGKEITYYKRYNVCAIFNIIIDEEDNDGKLENKDFAKPEIDAAGAIKKLRSAKTIDELKIFWKGLTKAEQGDSEVEGVKEEMKSQLK